MSLSHFPEWPESFGGVNEPVVPRLSGRHSVGILTFGIMPEIDMQQDGIFKGLFSSAPGASGRSMMEAAPGYPSGWSMKMA
jgi:hypothetical protein